MSSWMVYIDGQQPDEKGHMVKPREIMVVANKMMVEINPTNQQRELVFIVDGERASVFVSWMGVVKVG